MMALIKWKTLHTTWSMPQFMETILSTGQICIGLFVALVATYMLQGIILWILYYLFCLCCALTGLFMGASLALHSKQHIVSLDKKKPRAAKVLQQITDRYLKAESPKRGLMISHNLDQAIQEILDYIIRDYISSWYKEIAKDERIVQQVEYDIWLVLKKLSEKLSQIDLVKLITQDFACKLTTHFQDIRFAKERSKSGVRSKFLLLPWLGSEEKEVQFLRQITEVLMLELLPDAYLKCTLSRQLVREIITCRILKPAVDVLCDPDYINQQIFGYLEWREMLAEESGRTYRFAASYEDFIQMIQQLEDIEHLKQVRYTIISEIMQATTINNLKKAQGLEIDKDTSPRSSNKGDLLKARNLKRYINQLTVCKSLVEKRIRLLGGADYKGYGDDDEGNSEASKLPGNKVLSFAVIMENPITRDYFVRYLKRDDNHTLMGFWLAVETMKTAEKQRRYKLAGDIFEMFVNSSSSVVKLDRALLREMEAFLRGDKGPEAFYDAQHVIYRLLEKDHYTSFIVSDIYHVCVSSMRSGELEDAVRADHRSGDRVSDAMLRKVSVSTKDASFRDVQAYHASQKLAQIDERLYNKLQALKALKLTAKSDQKRAKLVADMEKETELLKRDKMDLEFHIERTTVWCDNVAKWTASVVSAETIRGDDDEEVPYFNVLVHLPDVDENDRKNMVHGWVVTRNLHDFNQLQTQLGQMCSWLKKKELPALSKFRFGAIKKSFLDKAKQMLEDFLVSILNDERMAQSETVYIFLSPSAEFIKSSMVSDQKKRFSLAKLFKTLPLNKDQDDSDDELLFYDDDSSKDDRAKDSIAEPLYALIGEIFELKGVFKWLRRTLIVFVQVTFGRTINRQLRETIDWMFSEPMLIYYIHVFRDAWWPGGTLADDPPPRTSEEKLKTRLQAKAKVVTFISDLSKNLIGENNAKFGAIKMFESLQDVRLNRHLFYVMLELCLYEIVPDLKESATKTT